MGLRRILNYLKQLMLWIWMGKYYVLTFMAVIVTILYVFGVWAFYPNLVASVLSILGLFIILSQQTKQEIKTIKYVIQIKNHLDSNWEHWF